MYRRCVARNIMLQEMLCVAGSIVRDRGCYMCDRNYVAGSVVCGRKCVCQKVL